MLVIILIFVIGLTPAIISAVQSYRANRKAAEHVNYALEVTTNQGLNALLSQDKDMHYVEGMGYMVGDITCSLNARSPYLRCATNPLGPCDGCKEYAPKIFDRQY
ncbi:DUF6464 family protein [Pseudanabaena sp. FACHB-2040]|uniref:DUF6464 family protein n=1 Tax=Pseudanabaena sp. FACHB-2040 TaxID=2692859 RepID=UPI0016826F23|nr:DUF6464 family protein [Pseudanabaena sp. FACHB-2040]MBD2258758.1 hypothetical protein [Pseudanabaena sp. FACHB-2040]